MAVGIGLVYYQVKKDFSGVQNRLGAINFLVALLSLASLSSLELCTCQHWSCVVRVFCGCCRMLSVAARRSYKS